MVVEYLESGKIETKIPHKQQFDIIKDRIPQEQYGVMLDELNRLFDETTIQTSSWIPGTDWAGTVWEPIYKACGNEDVAAKFFGQMVFAVVMGRNEKWVTGKFEMNGKAIRGRTYFRVERGGEELAKDNS